MNTCTFVFYKTSDIKSHRMELFFGLNNYHLALRADIGGFSL